MQSIQSLLARLQELGLVIEKPKRKQRTSVHIFRDPIDNVKYITYTTGAIRRECQAIYWGYPKISQCRINIRHKVGERQTPWGKVEQREFVWLHTEEERLVRLVQYMIRKNKRRAKKQLQKAA